MYICARMHDTGPIKKKTKKTIYQEIKTNEIHEFFVADKLKTITPIHETHEMFQIEQLVVLISLNGAVNDGQVADNTLRAHKARPAAFSISHVNNR